MGFKTTLVGVGPDLPRFDVQRHPEGGAQAAAEALVRLLPATSWQSLGTQDMGRGGYPGDEEQVGVSTFGPTTVLGGLAASTRIEEIRAAARAEGAMTWELNIHSVVDLCQFEGRDGRGQVVRSLVLTSDNFEDDLEQAAGEPLPFEEAFWAGERGMDDPESPTPFHPLDLGEAAIAWIFGLAGEGALDDSLHAGLGEIRWVDEIPMHGFAPVPAEKPRRRWFSRH